MYEIRYGLFSFLNYTGYFSCCLYISRDVWMTVRCSLDNKNVKEIFHFVCLSVEIYMIIGHVCRSDFIFHRGQRCSLHNGLYRAACLK